MRAQDTLADFNQTWGDAPVTRLGEWQEAIGVLRSVDRISGVITFRNLRVIVPPRELEALRDLESFTGRRVGILRTDLSDKPLLLRLAEEPGADEASKRLEVAPACHDASSG